jgi:hypothetical protein
MFEITEKKVSIDLSDYIIFRLEIQASVEKDRFTPRDEKGLNVEAREQTDLN